MWTLPDKPFPEYDCYDLLKIYARTGNFSDSARLAKVSRYAWSQHWYEVGLPSPISKRKVSQDDESIRYQIAIVSDLHWGSIYQQKTFFDDFIQECKDREITTLVNCGDTIDGIMPQPYHNESRFLHTTSDFEQYVQKNYPTGFENSYWISGNHEVSLSKFDWHYDFCKEISIRRSDLTYLDGGLLVAPGNIIIAVNHGGGSCSSPGQSRKKRLKTRALQYMANGQFAHIFVSGHCHSVCYVPSYMNSTLIGTGCFQAPNNYIKKSFGGADLCGLILSYQVSDGKPINIHTEFKYINEFGGVIENDY